jgi:hypothetical protein
MAFYRPSVGRLLLDIRDTAREALLQESKGHSHMVFLYVGKMRELVKTLESITEDNDKHNDRVLNETSGQ